MAVTIDFSELEQLININSYTKNKTGVDTVARLYSQWMTQLGFEAQTHQRDEIGNHVHYRSVRATGPKVLLLGHFDTVFPPGTFEGFSEDKDWVYGPGTCDMKGGNFVILQSLRAVKEKLGYLANIDVLMVSDEESGSDDSKHLTAKIATEYDLCLVFEAAGPDNDVVIERKGIATYQIELTGKAAHAGNHYADGLNANLAAAHMLLSLTELTNLDLGTTVNVGKMKGGIGANTISPSAVMHVEARFTNNNEKDRVLTTIEQIANSPKIDGITTNLSGGLQRDVMQSSEKQNDWIRRLELLTNRRFKLEKRGGVSDANVVSGVGVPTLDGFGPFGDGDHTIHERAKKSSFVQRIKLVSTILMNFAGSKTYQESNVA